MRLLQFTILCSLLTVFVGCGNKTVVSGTVKLSDGTPVKQGQVVFDDGKDSYFGQIKSDGSYSTGGNKTVEGVPPGNYKVWLAGTEITDNKLNDKGEVASYTTTLTVAKKYTSPQTTDLTFEVKPGGGKKFDVTVEPPPAKR